MSRAARLAGRRLWIGIPGTTLDAATSRHLATLRPGAIVLFGRNVASRDQVRDLVTQLRGLLGDDLRVAVDHEGGLVTRFPRELTVFPGNMALGAAAFPEIPTGEHLAEQQGLQSARELRTLGIDVNLAPVLDLMVRGSNPGIGTRSFGEHVPLACRLGSALVRGTLAGGGLPTAKHFPGKGAATVDAHLDLPKIASSEPMDPHLQPFRDVFAAGCPLTMSSHVVYEGLDAGVPATFSRAIVHTLLRERLGFEGVTITDDLEMGAMVKNYGFARVVAGASAAGHDVFCIAHRADRQSEAFEVLREGLERGESYFGDADAIEQRLDALLPSAADPRPLPDGAPLADAIAGRAVTVVRDDRHLLPLKDGQRIHLAVPSVRAETGVEDPLRGEDAMDLAQLLPGSVTMTRLPHQPTAEDVAAMMRAAVLCDRLLVVTTLARFDRAQAELARTAASHPGCVLLPLRNPFDLEVLPPDVTVTAVVPYGFRPVHLRALSRVLRGAVLPWGRLPVTLSYGAQP